MADDGVPGYDLGVMRQLILAAFTAEDLGRFCRDRPALRPIVDRFGPNHGFDDMVDEVIAYNEQFGLWDLFLAQVRAYNPTQYARFEARLEAEAWPVVDTGAGKPRRGLQIGEIQVPGCVVRNVVLAVSLALVAAAALMGPFQFLPGRPTPTTFATEVATSAPATSGPTAEVTRGPGPVEILTVYVDMGNDLHVVLDGVCQSYRLYARQPDQTFGDAPDYAYYRIYEAGVCPEDLLVVVDVNPATVYCIEVRSDDGLEGYGLVSYRTGEGQKPYVGTFDGAGGCPWE